MIKFKGQPNMLVRFNPPIGNIKYVRFDENGEFCTDNERIIKRFKHRFDSVPVKESIKEYKCKKCDFKTDNMGELLSHYRIEHPKKRRGEVNNG